MRSRVLVGQRIGAADQFAGVHPEEAGRRSRVLDDWCARVGRDPAEIKRSILREGLAQIARLDDYVENGITHLLVGADGPDYDVRQLEQVVRWRDSRST